MNALNTCKTTRISVSRGHLFNDQVHLGVQDFFLWFIGLISVYVNVILSTFDFDSLKNINLPPSSRNSLDIF